MGTSSDSPPGTRPYQFTLARMISWVIVAASVCFLIRNVVLVAVAGIALLPAVLLWTSVAGLGLVGALWRRFWDTLPGRLLLLVMFWLVVIPFSPILLFCLDWERLLAHWRLVWSPPRTEDLSKAGEVDSGPPARDA